MSEIEAVLNFWFGEGDRSDPAEFAAMSERWFAGGPEFDAEIRRQFEALWHRAAAGELDAWPETPTGRLALIVVLDQFSRHLARGTAAAFAQDAKACRLTLEGLVAGDDLGMTPMERVFFLMPLEHAEDPAVQDRSVAEFQRLYDEAPPAWRTPLTETLRYAHDHCDVITRFGRFPHRNQALGRTATPEEQAYLDGGGERWGQ